MASQHTISTDFTVELLGPGQANAEDVNTFLSSNFHQDSFFAHLGITDEGLAAKARSAMTELETYHSLTEGTTVIARSPRGETVGVLLSFPKSLQDKNGFKAQQANTKNKLTSYGAGVDKLHQTYLSQLDKLFAYNARDYPESDHAQLWLTDPIVKEGFDADISEALLKARLSAEGADRLRIGLIASDSSKAELYEKYGLGVIHQEPLNRPDHTKVDYDFRWRGPLDGTVFEE